jgi:hypothetical protein
MKIAIPQVFEKMYHRYYSMTHYTPMGVSYEKTVQGAQRPTGED